MKENKVRVKRQDGKIVFENPPKPHPHQKLIRESGIRQWHLSHVLGVSQSNLSQYLAGYGTIPKKAQGKLDEVIREIKKAMQDEDE